MMKELMNGQHGIESKISSSRQSNQGPKPGKSQPFNQEKNGFRNNQENSLTHHLFMQEQSEQSM